MKIFKTFQKNFALSHFIRNEHPFNRKHLECLLESFTSLTSTYLFLLCGKYSVREFMDSIYIITVGTGMFIGFVNTVYRILQIFDFIDAVEKTINDRKF